MGHAELLRLWRLADRLGYDGASLYDVLALPALEVWTTLSVLAVATRRLVSLPLVLDIAYRHPVTLAKMVAALDVLSRGRLILGLGYGGNLSDHTAYGFGLEPMAERVARLGEQIGVMRTLWCQPRASFEGRFYQLRDAVGFPSHTPGGPPVLVAGRGLRYALAGAARWGDLCNISFDLSADDWRAYQRVLAEHCAAVGRDPSSLGLTHNATVVIGATRDEAERRFDRLARWRRLTHEQARRGLANALVGTPDEIVGRLLAYRRAGVELAWVFLLFPDLPGTGSVRLFAERVLPAYRAAVA